MILEKLKNNGVVSFTISKDKKTIEVLEECDSHFYVDLTKSELSQLIKELQILHDSMEKEGQIKKYKKVFHVIDLSFKMCDRYAPDELKTAQYIPIKELIKYCLDELNKHNPDLSLIRTKMHETIEICKK